MSPVITGPTKSAPNTVHTKNEAKSPTVSVNSTGSCIFDDVAAPNSRPPTKAATKPLPPIATAPTYARSERARTTSCSEIADVQPSRRTTTSSLPPRMPTTTAATIARPISFAASAAQCPDPRPSSAITRLRNRVTNGVAIPSLRPLSTFSARRILAGTAGFVTTARPRAASVGARIDAISAAAAHPASGKSSSRRHGPESDRERQANEEQPNRQARIALHLAQPNGRGVREEQYAERELRDEERRLAFEAR